MSADAVDLTELGPQLSNDEKSCGNDVEKQPPLSLSDETSEDDDKTLVLTTERDVATHIIMVEDDPSLSCWTVRSMFLGLGLSCFGGVLAEIYYFKPQTVLVSVMFLAIISYVLGIFLETIIPRWGIFRYLNPFPFNKKENAFIVIMSLAAANSALGTEVLAVQRLYYNITPNGAASIFLLFSSQLLGYGIGGLMRGILLHPSKMLYPTILPLNSMFDAFFHDNSGNKKRLRLFYIAFFAIFFWEIVPEWMFPLLTGFSIFCLAQQNSLVFTNVFGGTDGNEGLGLLSICFDWQYISGGVNPMAIPLKAQFSNLIGYILCIVVFVIVYYRNIWQAQNFPFLSQVLFYQNGTQYDQLLILNENYEVDPVLLAEQGLPWYASTWIIQLISCNLGMAACITHFLLWNRDDLRAAWSWATPSELKKTWANFNWRFWQYDGMRDEALKNDPNIDPHYREMLKYKDAPGWWYMLTLLGSVVCALVLIYKDHSTLPWWGFVVSVLLSVISILFIGALFAITGFSFSVQPFVQMVGGYMHPGKPMANMYFVLYSSNSVSQAMLLLRDLKVGQYAKLPPRATYTAQMLGTLVGSILNYIMMNSIIDSQREILLSVEGTNIWSGQQPQQYNSQAIAWGGLARELFSSGKRYQWVSWSYIVGLVVPIPFWLAYRWWPKLRTDYLYTPVICYYLGWLCVGINSSILSYFTVAWASQWYLRTRYPRWFIKYNYIIAAALDGGMSVMVFILSFAVFGASGTAHPFPSWWGANQAGNYDRCEFNPAG